MGATVVPFTAQTRISGLDDGARSYRKGATDSLLRAIGATTAPAAVTQAVERIARAGSTPLASRRNRPRRPRLRLSLSQQQEP